MPYVFDAALAWESESPTKTVARFEIDGGIRLVTFTRIDETTWQVDVDESPVPFTLALRVLDGIFKLVTEFAQRQERYSDVRERRS